MLNLTFLYVAAFLWVSMLTIWLDLRPKTSELGLKKITFWLTVSALLTLNATREDLKSP